MIRPRLALLREADHFAKRAEELAGRLAAGEDVCQPYADALRTLAVLTPAAELGDARTLLTSREVADHLGVSCRTLRRRQAAGKIAPARPGGRGRSALWPVEAAR